MRVLRTAFDAKLKQNNQKQKISNNITFAAKYLTRANAHPTAKKVDMFISEVVDPFIGESKYIYKEGRANHKNAEAMYDYFRAPDNALHSLKSEPTKIPGFKIFAQVEENLVKYDEYQHNIREYKYLAEKGNSWRYSTDEISKKIEDMKSVIYKRHRALNDMAPFAKMRTKTLKDISHGLKNIKLETLNPELYKKQRSLVDASSKSSFPLSFTPFRKAETVKKQALEGINGYNAGSLQEGGVSKVFECTQFSHDAFKLNEEITTFNELKPDIVKSILESSKMPVVTQQEVDGAYEKLNKKALRVVSHNAAKLKKSFAIYPGFTWNPANNAKVDEILANQKKANIELWNLIEKAKSDYMAGASKRKEVRDAEFEKWKDDISQSGLKFDDIPF